MSDLKFTIPSDTTNEIKLASQILSLSWNSATAYPGRLVTFQVLLSFVGYGAPIKITLKNDNGETLAQLSDKVRLHIYTGRFKVPEDCESGESIYFEVNLPKNDLKGESEKIPIILPIEIKEMKWSTDQVKREDIVSLKVRTRKCPDMTPAKIIIFEYQVHGYHEKVTEMQSTIVDNELELEWCFEYPFDTGDIPTEAELSKYNGTYTAPAYFFKVIINDVTYGNKQESGFLTFTDFIELELTDETGKPVSEAVYLLIPPDGGAAIKGHLDQKGYACLDEIKPGPYGLEFPEHECELPFELKSGIRINSLAVQYFVLLDAGAWQADQAGNATTTFGLIAGGDIVLCSWLKTYRGKLTDNASHHIKNLLGYLQLKGPSRGYVIEQVHLKKAVYEDNRLLILIPDLHLHYFREEGWDNFITKKDGWGEIESLEDELVRFLTLTRYWAEQNGVDVEFIQLGDCYELWESELVLEKKIRDEQYYILQYHLMLNEGYSFHLLKEIEDCEKRKKEYEKERSKFNDPYYLEQEIKKRYKNLFNCDVKMLNLQGNHDNKLNNPPNIERGIGKFIALEHGHAIDPYNSDKKWKKGYSMVRKLVRIEHISEPVRLGDLAKRMEPILEPDRPQMFIKYAFNQMLDKDKRVFVMGHTHNPKLMKKNLREVTKLLKEKKSLREHKKFTVFKY